MRVSGPPFTTQWFRAGKHWVVSFSRLTVAGRPTASDHLARTLDDVELIAQQVEHLAEKLEGFERRGGEVEKVNARLELAALTTARALAEIATHWDAVYDAMRRPEES